MSLTIDIKVVPQSGKQMCILDKNGKLKCYLKSAPERGEANVELINFISKSLKVQQSVIKILLGATSRNKRIQIDVEIGLDEFLKKLGVEKQGSIS